MIPENALYYRDHEVVIGTRQGNKLPSDGRLFKNRVKFSVTKTSTSEPNNGEITLYNISQESMAALENKNAVVFLKAGYVGNISNIYFGDIRRREVIKEGPDIGYSLECGDSEIALRNSIINIGLGSNATNEQLFDQAAKSLGLSLNIKKGVKQLVYKNGFSEIGSAKELLDNLTKNLDLEWNVQDGELRILPTGELDGSEAVVIGPESGLIGFPTKTIDGLKFRSLLIPQLKVGAPVKVISKLFTGEFGPNSAQLASASLVESGDILKVRKVTFTGDTRGREWFADVEAVIPRSGVV